MASCKRLVIPDSSNDQTHVWTISFTEFVFKALLMFVINARNWCCPNYYPSNSSLDVLSGGLLFRLNDKILDTLKYFTLFKSVLLMSTNLLLMATTLHRCGKVDCELMSAWDSFSSYSF